MAAVEVQQRYITLFYFALCATYVAKGNAQENETIADLIRETNSLLLRLINTIQCNCPSPFQQRSGMCLFLHSYQYFRYWIYADQFCYSSLQGFLAEYNTQEEFYIIADYAREKLMAGSIGYSNGAWIGGSDVNEEGNFEWRHSGKPVPMGYGWGPGQPDGNHYEHYTLIVPEFNFTVYDVYNPLGEYGSGARALCQRYC